MNRRNALGVHRRDRQRPEPRKIAIALNRKNALVAGHDEGAKAWPASPHRLKRPI